MTITKNVSLYEILIRFNADGFQGAHVIEREELIEDGAVLSARELPARPVTEKEVGVYVGKKNAKLIEAADGARSDCETAKTDKDAAERAAEKAEAVAKGLEQQRDDLMSELDRTRKALGETSLELAVLKSGKAGKPRAARG